MNRFKKSGDTNWWSCAKKSKWFQIFSWNSFQARLITDEIETEIKTKTKNVNSKYKKREKNQDFWLDCKSIAIDNHEDDDDAEILH